ncbi:MAG TPA: SGNH/GDSL hydrolase family protein [Terriglobia bacterium]|nr:SGNH/GDSL hydrolase family protein [Terriglobia bacterium]
MNRRLFLRNTSSSLVGLAGGVAVHSKSGQAEGGESSSIAGPGAAPWVKPKDYRREPFHRFVILGESTVEGGPWLREKEDRYADVLVRLINAVQERPIEYINKGIGNNSISPRSPGYGQSAKPSAIERYRKDVIEHRPDLFILAYGLNDMRAGMPLEHFRADMATIIRDVKNACDPVTVLTTVYYMTGYRSWPPINKGSIELTLKYNECIRSLAGEFDCIVADLWSAEGGADWLIHYDGVHANKVGNLVLGNKLFEAIAQHCSGLSQYVFQQERETEWTKMTTQKRAEAGDPFTKTW